MPIKSFILAVLCVFYSLSYSANTILINKCPITSTDNPFDLALLNDGFFVVSKGKHDSERYYTRFGKFMLNKDYYLITESGYFVLGLRKKEDPKKLHKIKISQQPLAPKATSQVEIGLNLPANLPQDDYRIVSSAVYDSISNTHIFNVKFAKKEMNQWDAIVSVDDIELGHGSLIFDHSGTLIAQQGFEHLQWPTDYGLNDLSVRFVDTSQWGIPFELRFLQADGYPAGRFVSASVSVDGDIYLLYNNGQDKPLKNRISVAKFINPGYLESISNNLYRQTEQSGAPRLHWLNGEPFVRSASLEYNNCLVH